MKVWRLFSGTVSIVLFFFILVQSAAMGMLNGITNILTGSELNNGLAGIAMAFLLLIAGIISTALWSDDSKVGDVALAILFWAAAAWGANHLKGFGDMRLYTLWAFICSVISGAVACVLHENDNSSQ